MFDSIRKSIGNYVIRSKTKGRKRARKVSNFDQAVRIGIIYDATNRNSYQSILKFLQFLKEERKKVTSIGFINSKDETQFISSRQNDHFITGKDLTGVRLPKKLPEVGSFIKEEFDVLIDLNTAEHMPLKYIFALSGARFKVAGDLPYQREYGDLTIDVSQNRTVEYLIIQVKHYLKIVNKTKESYAI